MSIQFLPAVPDSPSPVVEIVDNRAMVSSLNVAWVFQKQHKNIIQAIENIECSEDFNRLNFQPVTYKDAKGESRKAFNLTRDGFTFLAMGFTGKKAAQFKEAYINAFNQMEEALRNQPVRPVNQYVEMSRSAILMEAAQIAQENEVLITENRELVETVEIQQEVLAEHEEEIEKLKSKSLRKFLLATPVALKKGGKDVDLNTKLEICRSLGYVEKHRQGPHVPTNLAVSLGYAYQSLFTPPKQNKALPFTLITPKGQREIPKQIQTYVNKTIS